MIDTVDVDNFRNLATTNVLILRWRSGGFHVRLVEPSLLVRFSAEGEVLETISEQR